MSNLAILKVSYSQKRFFMVSHTSKTNKTRLKRLILGSRTKIINLDYRLDRLDRPDRLDRLERLERLDRLDRLDRPNRLDRLDRLEYI